MKTALLILLLLLLCPVGYYLRKLPYRYYHNNETIGEDLNKFLEWYRGKTKRKNKHKH